MTQEEIIKGNKIIAEFMGWKRSLIESLSTVDLGGYYTIGVPHSQTMYNKPYADIDLLKFNSSWDWLMTVIERVENISRDPLHGKFGVYIGSNCCTIQGSKMLTNVYKVYFQDHYASTKIEATWVAIVNFIEWHNNTLK